MSSRDMPFGADASRAHFGTDAHAMGVLLGSALAVVWVPGRMRRDAALRVRVLLDAVGLLAMIGVESCVLTVLESGPAYSHDIVRTLADVEGMVTSEGTVYPMLSQLRRAGLVQTRWQESPTGPPRRYCELAAAGHHAVAAFAVAWRTFRSGVDRIVNRPPGTFPPPDAGATDYPDPTSPNRTEETA